MDIGGVAAAGDAAGRRFGEGVTRRPVSACVRRAPRHCASCSSNHMPSLTKSKSRGSNNSRVASAAATQLPEVHAGNRLQVRSGDCEAVRPRSASPRVLLANSPCVAAVALAVVGDFLLPALRLLAGSICPSVRQCGRQRSSSTAAGHLLTTPVYSRLALSGVVSFWTRTVLRPKAAMHVHHS